VLFFSKKKEGSGTHRLTGRRQELVKPIPGKEASGTPFRLAFFWEITYGTVFRHENTPAYNKTCSISARETSCSWENEVLGPCLLTGTVNKFLLPMYSTGFLEIVPLPPSLQCYNVKEQIWANDSLTPRTCDSAALTAAGPSSQTHHHVKTAPKKGPVPRLDGKILCHMLLKLPGIEKKNCVIRQCRMCTENIRSGRTFFCTGTHYILAIAVPDP
jgi:hypothetical protein